MFLIVIVQIPTWLTSNSEQVIVNMPPLRQVKTLIYLSQTAFSSWYSLAIHNNPTIKVDLFEHLPQSLAEETSYYVLQAAFAVIHHFGSKCDPDLDDAVLIQEHCLYLQKVLSKLLDGKSRFIDVNFDIDMRTFANFKSPATEERPDNPSTIPEQVILTEQLIQENDSLSQISQTFVKHFETEGLKLEVFNPGLFIIDRPKEEDYDIEEVHKVSLCWNEPQVLISLVDHCESLQTLNLLGYEELTDLALDYIAGTIGDSPGLQNLIEITLPKKCFVTTEGIRSLIENLSKLELIENQGKMGTMIQIQILPSIYNLKEFSQLESTTSGGLDESEIVDNFGEEVQGWSPNKNDIKHLTHCFPKLKSMKLLMEDSELLKLSDEDLLWDLNQLEIHLLTPSIISKGIHRFCISFSDHLVSLKLTVLDCVSFHSILMIAKHCQELKLFHLEIWEKLILDEDIIGDNYFGKLEDLKIECEHYTEPLTFNVMKFFMGCHSLKIVQYFAHLTWLTDEDFQSLWKLSALQR